MINFDEDFIRLIVNPEFERGLVLTSLAQHLFCMYWARWLIVVNLSVCQ